MPQAVWRVTVADDHADTRDLYAEVLVDLLPFPGRRGDDGS